MDQTTWKNCLEEKHEIDWLNLVVLITLRLHCQVGLCLDIKTKNIVDKPIVLTVYSHTCPDLTMIDLPGITRIPIDGQDANIE